MQVLLKLLFGFGLVALLLLSFFTTLFLLDLFSSESLIAVSSATYGGNCHAPAGNATALVQSACDGKKACDYSVTVEKLGDPAPGCSKDFSVDYACDATAKAAGASAEANGKSVHLSCP